MNRDTVIGIVGAVILVAAMVGVFQYERTRAPAALGTGSLLLSNVTIPEQTGQTTLGASSSAAVNVSTQNVTSITFTLKWTPQATPAGADTFKLELTAPSGVNATELTKTDASGTITLTVSIPNEKPTTGPTTLGMGTWNAKITFVSSTAPNMPPPVPVSRTDSWKLGAVAQAWAPAPTPSA